MHYKEPQKIWKKSSVISGESPLVNKIYKLHAVSLLVILSIIK